MIDRNRRSRFLATRRTDLALPAVAAQPLASPPPPFTLTRSAHGATGFYDRNTKICLTVTVAASTVGGIKLNKTLGPQTPLQIQPSTFAGGAAVLLSLLARHYKWRRTSQLLLAGAFGQGAATISTHLPDRALLASPKSTPTI